MGKELVFISNLPDGEELCTSTPKFNAAQFARALHLRIAKVSYEVWLDNRFYCAPAHVIYPWITFMGEVLKSLEEAAKVTKPPSVSAPERLSSLSGGKNTGLAGPY